ncbi:MAG: GNAT family N-acetyltransferase [Bacteroidales bacterium]
MDQQLDIRRFSKTYIKDIQDLSRVVFGKKISRNYYLTLFGEVDDYLGFIVFKGDRALAFFGAIEVQLNDGKMLHKAAQPVNIMVHPDYKHSNYFLLLYNKVLELSKERGIVLLFGWPNSELIFSKILRWDKVCNMQKLTLPVRTLPFGKIVFRIHLLFPLYKSFVKSVFKLFEQEYSSKISEFITPKQYPRIERSDFYLNQKFRLGAQLIEISKKKMIINTDYRLKIGDIEPCSIQDLKSIVKKLKRICFFTGLSEITIYLNPTNEQHQMIINNYNTKDDLALMYKMINPNSKIQPPSLTYTDFDTF